jgi:hypothetical protein
MRTARESHRTLRYAWVRELGPLRPSQTHFGTAGERFGRWASEEGGHVVVVEVDGVMG